MSEIEKMYKNAGIKCLHPSGFCKHIGAICEVCERHKYPPFTAEKQIELIKWLSDTDYYIHNIYKTIDTREYFIDNYYYDMQTDTFEETLAGLINKHWQDLSKEEKQQVKGILE